MERPSRFWLRLSQKETVPFQSPPLSGYRQGTDAGTPPGTDRCTVHPCLDSAPTGRRLGGTGRFVNMAGSVYYFRYWPSGHPGGPVSFPLPRLNRLSMVCRRGLREGVGGDDSLLRRGIKAPFSCLKRIGPLQTPPLSGCNNPV
jgi:hypothetical protein